MTSFRSLLTSRRVLLLSFVFAMAPDCNAQQALDARQILDELSKPQAPLVRSFKPVARPDGVTRLCRMPASEQASTATGGQGERQTRTLYVEEAPHVDLDIAFALAEASLLPEGARQLDQLAAAMRDPAMDTQKFVVVGHTDARGPKDFNDRLSCERALSARRYLVDKHHIDPERLVPMGFGFDKPKNSADPLAAENRRVEIRLQPR